MARIFAAVDDLRAERDALVASVRWAQDAPHHYDCAKFGDVRPCTCGRDEALKPFKEADRGCEVPMIDPLDLGAIERTASLGNLLDPYTLVGDVLALVAEVRHLRDLLTRALPHIDPNDNHDTYELVRAIEEATR